MILKQELKIFLKVDAKLYAQAVTRIKKESKRLKVLTKSLRQ